VKSRSTLLA